MAAKRNKAPKTAVAYLRVSTQGQAKSGLGLDAQRDAIRSFAKVEGFKITEFFEERETGKGADALDRRPELAAAIGMARKLGGPVIVSKLDRLSRDVHLSLLRVLPSSPARWCCSSTTARRRSTGRASR